MEDPSLLDSHLAPVSFSSGGSSTTVIALAAWDTPILELRIPGRFLTICTPDGSAPGTAPYRFLEALIFSFARFDRSTERLLFMSVQLSLPTIARFAALAMLDASFFSPGQLRLVPVLRRPRCPLRTFITIAQLVRLDFCRLHPDALQALLHSRLVLCSQFLSSQRVEWPTYQPHVAHLKCSGLLLTPNMRASSRRLSIS
jgi:hypothetical protein